jgi:hypothetical protein
VLSLPDLAVVNRVFVGLGASGIKVDARSDLIYVATRDEARLQVFDPFSFTAVDSIELPDAAGYLAIDDTENTLLALMPERRAIAYIDIPARRVSGVVDVGFDPYLVAIVRERF